MNGTFSPGNFTMNGTFNPDNFLLPNASGLCYNGQQIDVNCVYKSICDSTSGSFRGWGIGLLLAYVFVDIALPFLLAWLKPNIEPLKLAFPFLASLPDLRQPEGRMRALWWLKDRLLWAFWVLTLYQIGLSGF
jgi:hypothetical protein